MRIAKVDANQKAIVRALRQLGFKVAHTHTLGKGVPDILVGGWRGDGKPALLWCEIKTAKGELTPDEAAFHKRWAGLPVVIVREVGDVLEWYDRFR